MDRIPHRLRRHRTEFGQTSPGDVVVSHLEPTKILDWRAPWTEELLARSALSAGASDLEALRTIHRTIATTVDGVYAFNELQPASRTWGRRRGSCSQRLALLEAAARAIDIPTCVRGIWVDGRFWYPRFPRLRFAVPDEVLLAWPSFRIVDTWIAVSELFGSVETLARSNPTVFGNDGETLYDALTRTAIDWDGVTATTATCAQCDLSRKVTRDLGYFPTRDALFAGNGQTLSAPSRGVAQLVVGRRSLHSLNHDAT